MRALQNAHVMGIWLLLALAGCGGGGTEQTDLAGYLLPATQRDLHYDLYLGDSTDAVVLSDYERTRWRARDGGLYFDSDAGVSGVMLVEASAVREQLQAGEQRLWPRFVRSKGVQQVARTSSQTPATLFDLLGPMPLVTVRWQGEPLRSYSDVIQLLHWQADTLTLFLYARGIGLVATLSYDVCPKPASLSASFNVYLSCGHADEVLVLSRDQEVIEPTDPADPTDPTDPVDPTDPTVPEDPTDPGDPSDPADPADPTDPTDPTDPIDPTEPPRLILVRDDPVPAPDDDAGDDADAGDAGEGGEEDERPSEPVGLDFFAWFVPPVATNQNFDGFSYYLGRLDSYPDDLQIYWQAEQDGFRAQDSGGDSYLITATEDRVLAQADTGAAVDYPRWLFPDESISYQLRDESGQLSEQTLYVAGPYWSARVEIDAQHIYSFSSVLVTVQRIDDDEDGLVSMVLALYTPDAARVASFVWYDCDADLVPRPDADFVGQCAEDIYVDVQVTP